jgi:diguanylate cyclase (GGDEF)-like protein
MAQVLTQMVRTGDYIARWGGEEFLVVFRPMPNRHLPMLGDRICQAVAGHRFDVGTGEPLQVTCSVGFIECPLFRDARGGLGWEQMIELADRALYFVKTHGRNGWAAYRARRDTDLGGLQAALAGDPERLVDTGRLDLVGSAHLDPPGGSPAP